MFKRVISDKIKESAQKLPVVTILGPLQSGKTTLVKKLFPNYTYINLEDKVTRELAENDYIGFFNKYKEPMIIDEVQRVPELLSEIQSRVDEDRHKNGRFILTSSYQPKLKYVVTQSLAGRTAIHTLLPFCFEEIKQKKKVFDINEIMIHGFMPKLYVKDSKNFYTYYRDYINTFIERDLRLLLNVKDLNAFHNFLVMLASMVGKPVNLNSISAEIGISSTTLKQWLTTLEDSFIVSRLPAYFSNKRKRVLKSSKIYFVDPGLVSYLLGIKTPKQALKHPLRENIFENIVVLEALKTRLNANKSPNLFYMRTEKGIEVDLILRKKDMIYPFEIKSSTTSNSEFTRNLRLFCKSEENAKQMSIIYCGEEQELYDECRYINYHNISKNFI